MSENGEIYTAGKNFTLPPALTALTNSTSGHERMFNNLLTIESVKKIPLTFLRKDTNPCNKIPCIPQICDGFDLFSNF